MTTRKKAQRGGRGKVADDYTPDDTAERLAALLESERLPEALRDTLQGEVLSFVERLGGFIAPDVLRLVYGALCIQAGDDPLRRVVESLARPERLPKGERGDASHLKQFTGPGLSKYHTMVGGYLSHLGIFKGDQLTIETAQEITRKDYRRPIESGDMVVLSDREVWHVGELRVEGNRVLLVSTYPAKVFRSKDVTLFGRVSEVRRRVAHRADVERGEQ
ncbi:MAG: hypothetical protein QOH49_493 [Acidobacteriota bacterium]|jgi:hypothetical protein|nr:hypothetical protein [Acidobacteriota bacterium]